MLQALIAEHSNLLHQHEALKDKYDKSEESLKLGLKLFEKAHDYEFIGHKKNPFCYHNIK